MLLVKRIYKLHKTCSKVSCSVSESVKETPPITGLKCVHCVCNKFNRQAIKPKGAKITGNTATVIFLNQPKILSPKLNRIAETLSRLVNTCTSVMCCV